MCGSKQGAAGCQGYQAQQLLHPAGQMAHRIPPGWLKLLQCCRTLDGQLAKQGQEHHAGGWQKEQHLYGGRLRAAQRGQA